MFRKTMKDWSLSDGSVIPAGTVVGVASAPMNRDEVRLATGRTVNSAQIYSVVFPRTRDVQRIQIRRPPQRRRRT